MVSRDGFASLSLDTPPQKKKRYCMEIYYQVLVFYLLLINAES